MKEEVPAEAPAKKRGRKPKAAVEAAPVETPAEAPVKKPRAPCKKKVEENPKEQEHNNTRVPVFDRCAFLADNCFVNMAGELTGSLAILILAAREESWTGTRLWR